LTAAVAKRHHEVRDAVHVFIHFGDAERAVIDSAPFQRLRHIHQLALSYLVYPGASHKRFEHSLGVMDVAGRIFDVVTRPDKVTDRVRDVIPEYGGSEHQYWRTVLQMAALCHDTGHLPFSHAAEEDLLPEGWDHERITREIIHSPEMLAVWDSMRPKPDPDDVVKLALGPRKIEKLRLGLSFDAWQAILAEIIVGDVFGADRIDYLLRDSLHTGVAYGRFDYHRLIETLRIIPGAPEGTNASDDVDPQLGCERGGLESAEALMLARYFMFAQVYYHPTRLAYNEHLKDFLAAWLPEEPSRPTRQSTCATPTTRCLRRSEPPPPTPIPTVTTPRDGSSSAITSASPTTANQTTSAPARSPHARSPRPARSSSGMSRCATARARAAAIRPTFRCSTATARACPRSRCPRC
jgi:uncharacterized protein